MASTLPLSRIAAGRTKVLLVLAMLPSTLSRIAAGRSKILLVLAMLPSPSGGGRAAQTRLNVHQPQAARVGGLRPENKTGRH